MVIDDLTDLRLAAFDHSSVGRQVAKAWRLASRESSLAAGSTR
jgi:hypothetical protein